MGNRAGRKRRSRVAGKLECELEKGSNLTSPGRHPDATDGATASGPWRRPPALTQTRGGTGASLDLSLAAHRRKRSAPWQRCRRKKSRGRGTGAVRISAAILRRGDSGRRTARARRSPDKARQGSPRANLLARRSNPRLPPARARRQRAGTQQASHSRAASGQHGTTPRAGAGDAALGRAWTHRATSMNVRMGRIRGSRGRDHTERGGHTSASARAFAHGVVLSFFPLSCFPEWLRRPSRSCFLELHTVCRAEAGRGVCSRWETRCTMRSRSRTWTLTRCARAPASA
jgi:hypothetical protein